MQLKRLMWGKWLTVSGHGSHIIVCRSHFRLFSFNHCCPCPLLSFRVWPWKVSFRHNQVTRPSTHPSTGQSRGSNTIDPADLSHHVLSFLVAFERMMRTRWSGPFFRTLRFYPGVKVTGCHCAARTWLCVGFFSWLIAWAHSQLALFTNGSGDTVGAYVGLTLQFVYTG